MTGRSNGGPSASPPLVRAVMICKDGQWHDFEEVVREVGKVIPPGKAMRRAERNRILSGGPPQRCAKYDVTRIMAAGKRSLARDFVRPPWFVIEPAGRVPAGTPRRVRLIKLPARIQFPSTESEPLTWAG